MTNLLLSSRQGEFSFVTQRLENKIKKKMNEEDKKRDIMRRVVEEGGFKPDDITYTHEIKTKAPARAREETSRLGQEYPKSFSSLFPRSSLAFRELTNSGIVVTLNKIHRVIREIWPKYY